MTEQYAEYENDDDHEEDPTTELDVLDEIYN